MAISFKEMRDTLEQAYITCSECAATLEIHKMKWDSYKLCIRTRKKIEPLLVFLDRILPRSTTDRPGWPELRKEED